MHTGSHDPLTAARVSEVVAARWRWRYEDPESGELVDPSEPMTPEEVRRVDPHAQVIPGTRS